MNASAAPDQIALRPATERDCPLVRQIGESAYWSNFERFEPGAGEVADYRQRVGEMFENDGRRLWPHGFVAEFGCKPAGWGVRDVAMGWVRELWIAAPFQRRGIGRAMLDRFIGEIAARGQHDYAFIDTHARNEGAIRLYELAGFRHHKQESRWSVGLQRPIPIAVMVRALAT